MKCNKCGVEDEKIDIKQDYLSLGLGGKTCYYRGCVCAYNLCESCFNKEVEK